MTRRAPTFHSISCAWCRSSFVPASSKQKHCAPECRFKQIASVFSGEEGCWEWPLALFSATGYGQFTLKPREKVDTAHRVSYRIFNGEIPEGMFVCHSCDNRKCFNPAHLFVGTPADNIGDMWAKGRQQDYSKVPRGDAHPLVKNPSRAAWKLTPQDALVVKFWLSAGETKVAAAKKFGVSANVIQSVSEGRYDKIIDGKAYMAAVKRSDSRASGVK